MESNENKSNQNNWRNSINVKWNKVRQDSSKILVSTGKLLQIKDQPSADKWQSYRKIIEQDPPPTVIPRDKTLKNLIRYVGIPQDMRAKMWTLLTRAAQNYCDNKLEYPEILRNQMGKSNESISQIEKDLHRTMPRNEYWDKEKDIPRLRNVLVAYSWINPYVGYCQAMNFVCGILLIVMKDEMAFWMMRSIVEDILPTDYYASDLLGIKVDTEVIKALLEQKLPRISEHLTKLDVVLLPIISEWFLTLFVNCLPYENALRFLDSFFSEGSKILFRFALALFKYNEQKILELHSFEEAFSFVKDMPARLTDAQMMKEVMDLSFDGLWLGSMSLVTISELRRFYESKLITEKQKAHLKALKRENRKAILLAENAPPPPTNKHLHYMSSDHRMSSDLTELGYLLPSKHTRSAFVARPFRVNVMAEIKVIEDYVTPPVNFVYNNGTTSLSPPVSPRSLKPSNTNTPTDTPPASPKRAASGHVWHLVKVPSTSKLQRNQDMNS